MRRVGLDELNVDLIYGVRPTEPDCDPLIAWQTTIEEIITWKPQHISAYGLTIEEGTSFWKNIQAGIRVQVDESVERE